MLLSEGEKKAIEDEKYNIRHKEFQILRKVKHIPPELISGTPRLHANYK